MRAAGPVAAAPSRLGMVFGMLLVALLALPVGVLVLSVSPTQLLQGMASPVFGPALWLSLRTSAWSLALTVTLGTPLSWWLASSQSRGARWVQALVDLPVVMPPAVTGVALLRSFGRQGVFGPALEGMGVSLPFSAAAVVVAQVVVSAPFFVQGATSAFRRVDQDLLIVARTLGASPWQTFARVAVPVALPGLLAGASLSWARSLGEFGATLLFAGNLPGRTQTLPLAIFAALESDVHLAVVFAVLLCAVAALVLVGLHTLPRWVRHGMGAGWRRAR